MLSCLCHLGGCAGPATGTAVLFDEADLGHVPVRCLARPSCEGSVRGSATLSFALLLFLSRVPIL
jgi:hypothetical protein